LGRSPSVSRSGFVPRVAPRMPRRLVDAVVAEVEQQGETGGE
jgi:hypothetical protein